MLWVQEKNNHLAQKSQLHPQMIRIQVAFIKLVTYFDSLLTMKDFMAMTSTYFNQLFFLLRQLTAMFCDSFYISFPSRHFQCFQNQMIRMIFQQIRRNGCCRTVKLWYWGEKTKQPVFITDKETTSHRSPLARMNCLLVARKWATTSEVTALDFKTRLVDEDRTAIVCMALEGAGRSKFQGHPNKSYNSVFLEWRVLPGNPSERFINTPHSASIWMTEWYETESFNLLTDLPIKSPHVCRFS